MDLAYTLEMSALTDIGLVREHNEDAVFADAGLGLAILADGMGGYNAGEVAAEMLVSRLAENLDELQRLSLPNGSPPDRLGVVRELEVRIALVNEEIYQLAHSDVRYTGMGTTLVMGVFVHDFLITAHVGDSRCYRLRQGDLTLLTRDHSLLQTQIDCGLITPEEARFSSIRNLVTRAVGVESMVESEFNGYDVACNDIYLFCSDGLHDTLMDSEIAHILEAQAGDLHTAAVTLIAEANARGGQDNISVILVRTGDRSDIKNNHPAS
ncbi:MAG: protein phosphatase 2C domain-containing protein [Zoogloeaceae bacterium]|jgi:protein phosphatase|nr:protein phosphatase 2C domain-containing protein [Zoogloeaceae bacterium]